jgi:hypothetical protein
VRFRIMLQIRSSGSRRPVSGREADPALGAVPLNESSQITPGSYAQLGKDLVQVAFHGAD